MDFLDAPVSGGPKGANSGRLAIWVGGDKGGVRQIPCRRCPRWVTRRAYIGPIGAGSIAKLVHNASSAAVNVVLSEVFTMGIKAGVEPLALFEAVRQGASGRNRMFDRLADHFLTGSYDPADFALAPAAQGRLARLPIGPRGAGADAPDQHGADGTDRGAEPQAGARAIPASASLLQQERAGIAPIAVPPEKIKAVLAADTK